MNKREHHRLTRNLSAKPAQDIPFCSIFPFFQYSPIHDLALSIITSFKELKTLTLICTTFLDSFLGNVTICDSHRHFWVCVRFSICCEKKCLLSIFILSSIREESSWCQLEDLEEVKMRFAHLEFIFHLLSTAQRRNWSIFVKLIVHRCSILFWITHLTRYSWVHYPKEVLLHFSCRLNE